MNGNGSLNGLLGGVLTATSSRYAPPPRASGDRSPVEDEKHRKYLVDQIATYQREEERARERRVWWESKLAKHDAETKRYVSTERRAEGWAGSSDEMPPGPRGLEYRCHQCGADLTSPSGARKHEKTNPGHTVLRVDWHADDYWPFVLARRANRNGTHDAT